VGALLVAVMAHVAGLVAAGLYPSPVEIADVTTTTTHKTLRGPRGGMILAPRRSELTDRIDAGVFPGTQGGPLMHVVAAKAAALREALEPEFKDYQRQTLANARTLAAALAHRGFRIVSGGTDNHMVLVDLRGAPIDAARAESALDAAHIAVNRVSLPGDTSSEPTQGDSGLRLGTPAVTTRGLREPDIARIATWIADILDNPCEEVVTKVRNEVLALCASFPVYGAQ
jgi:glycine hydroxymethyltransferase